MRFGMTTGIPGADQLMNKNIVKPCSEKGCIGVAAEFGFTLQLSKGCFLRKPPRTFARRVPTEVRVYSEANVDKYPVRRLCKMRKVHPKRLLCLVSATSYLTVLGKMQRTVGPE